MRYFAELANDEDLVEWYLVLEALEIKLRPGELSIPEYLNLTWELVGYSTEEIAVQLYFEYPSRVSETQQYDTLEVYFWGT